MGIYAKLDTTDTCFNAGVLDYFFATLEPMSENELFELAKKYIDKELGDLFCSGCYPSLEEVTAEESDSNGRIMVLLSKIGFEERLSC